MQLAHAAFVAWRAAAAARAALRRRRERAARRLAAWRGARCLRAWLREARAARLAAVQVAHWTRDGAPARLQCELLMLCSHHTRSVVYNRLLNGLHRRQALQW